MLSGSQWEKTLLDFAEKFETHKKELHRDLTMFSASGIEQTHVKLSAVAETIDKLQLFASLRPREERDLQKFIDDNGGPDAVWGDADLREKLEQLADESEISREEKFMSRATNIFDEIGRDLQSTMQQLFNENQRTFEVHFQSRWDRLVGSLQTSLPQVNHEQSPWTEVQDDVSVTILQHTSLTGHLRTYGHYGGTG